MRLKKRCYRLSESRGEWPDMDLDLPSEDKREQAIYSFFDRIDKAHEDEADAIADAVSYMVENPNPRSSLPHESTKRSTSPDKSSPNISATAASCKIWPKSSDSSGPAPAAKN